MIVKFFANRGTGSPKVSIDYLRGKDCKRELATVLSGDPDLAQSIAESSEFKNRYTVGCLSFEERDLPMKSKREIMEKFEETMFAGLEKEQYAITWIEHRDKERLELNFFIANTELTTGKRLQPYYDKVDRALTNSFQEVINQDYGLSDPYDPGRKQLVKIDKTIPRSTKDFKEEITGFFIEKIQSGKITDRKQIIEILIKSGIEITRKTEKSISIKNPMEEKGRNIRLDGEISSKEFYSDLGKNKKGLPTEQDNYYKTRQESYEKAVILLEKLTLNREFRNREKYCIKDDFKKVENENEQKRTFKEVRAELERRASERKRAYRGVSQGINGRVESDTIDSNAECTASHTESFKREILERSNTHIDSNSNHRSDRDIELSNMERIQGERRDQTRNSSIEESERELRRVERIREAKLDRDSEGRERRSISMDNEQEKDSVRAENRRESAENSEIKEGFYHELSGRVKELISRVRGGIRGTEESFRGRDREFKQKEFELNQYENQSDERKRKLNEYDRNAEQSNREVEERERGIVESYRFAQEIYRSITKTEHKVQRNHGTERKVAKKDQDRGMDFSR